ncbi:hypothetical protein RUM44_009623 [Polyplax serrata]|uniref:Calcineurin-like phosphoesterase domain-containing protein n=1 Tax=Polyplax serrata TaxID=468196 RepID=A0ABR1ATB3_POLSC
MNVHPLTNNPTDVWKELSKFQKFEKVKHNKPSHPVAADKLRIVCVSDTHSLTNHIKFKIPDGDVLIHAGDVSQCGRVEEIIDFNDWLGKLPHKHKIVIAGNHELSFDEDFKSSQKSNKRNKIPTFGIPKHKIEEAIASPSPKQYLSNCIYLEDSEIVLYGIKFYGTPWQPKFHNWAFNLPRGEKCLEKWNQIPDDTDILITHTPPLGHGDYCYTGVRAGCVELLQTIQKRVKPKYHIFGHIHEGYGTTTDGNTVFVNASTCDIYYNPVNEPIVFDISLPPGVKK